MNVNDILLGDNLEHLRAFPDACCQFIYTDPPFNVNYNFNNIQTAMSVIQDKTIMSQQFEDTWKWNDTHVEKYNSLVKHTFPFNNTIKTALESLYIDEGQSSSMAYILFLTERVAECCRILDENGVLFLHCDNTEATNIERILRGIFGKKNVSRIIWERSTGHFNAKDYGNVTDVIFFCHKGKFLWNGLTFELTDRYKNKSYLNCDNNGHWKSDDLTGPGNKNINTNSSNSWRGIDPSKKGKSGRGWSIPERGLPDWFKKPDNWNDLSKQQKLDILDSKGLIHWPVKGGMPRFKRYLSGKSGKPVQNLIKYEDIPNINSHSDENRLYPTQKPQKLLELLIGQHTKEGDLVIDPFMGSGTTIFACVATGRKYIGIDQNIDAYTIVKEHLKSIGSEKFKIKTDIANPRDIAEWKQLVKEKGEYDGFQVPACSVLGFSCNKRGADGGIDGTSRIINDERILVLCCTVKLDINKLTSDVGKLISNGGVACICVFCLNEPTKGCYDKAKSFGNIGIGVETYPKVQILTVKDFFKGGGLLLPERSTFSDKTNDNVKNVVVCYEDGLMEKIEYIGDVELYEE